MKAEDKFYFGKPGQPERFGDVGSDDNKIRYYLGEAESAIRHNAGNEIVESFVNKAESLVQDKTPDELRIRIRRIKSMMRGKGFSRPGQPERFDMEGACWEGYEPVGTKQKDGRTVPNCVPKDENAEPEEFAAKQRSAIQVTDAEYAALVAADAEMEQWLKYQYQPTQQQKAIRDAGKAAMASALARLNATHKKWESASSDAERAQIEKQYAASGRSYKSKHFSRPGQPDKFDASSLNRGDFAEASASPMLGKLLSEKVMPEGGWRAVETGDGALVISFEDADLARDFGRRVATKGYNATSPVQAIGRYWNVEVKNGK